MDSRLPRPAAPACFVLLALPLAACGAKGGGLAGEVGTYSGGSFAGEDAGLSPALDASIQANHITVTVVRLGCSNACADVEAVPTGGHPPYTFAWEDGSTSATRHLCPRADASYAVAVTDTGTTGEFAQPPQTAHAQLTADVTACPDAGSTSTGGLCVSNPSFEGTPTAAYDKDLGAPPWVGCVQTPFNSAGLAVGNSSDIAGTLPPATDGSTYLIVNAVAVFDAAGTVSAPLCAALHAGTTYHMKLDVASLERLGGAPGLIQITGSTSSCGAGEVLWTSPPAPASWQTYCATFTPTMDDAYIGLAGAEQEAGAASQVLVDHLVPVDACP